MRIFLESWGEFFYLAGAGHPAHRDAAACRFPVSAAVRLGCSRRGNFGVTVKAAVPSAGAGSQSSQLPAPAGLTAELATHVVAVTDAIYARARSGQKRRIKTR